MRLLVIMVFTLLSGCSYLGIAQTAAGQYGAEISDSARDRAEFMLCRGITVGSWIRRFGDSADLANAWRTLCSEQIKQVPK